MSGTAQQTAIDIGRPVRPASGGTWLAGYLTERRLHKSPQAVKRDVGSPANVMTLVRAVVAAATLALAVHMGWHALFVAALVINWVMDIADGEIARRSLHETVFGAQLDALVDRFTVLMVAIGSAVLADGSTVAVAAAVAVSIQFVFVDQLLFNQFLLFDLWTPDEFHLVDESVWRINWSTLAKLVGGIPVALIAIGGVAAYFALAGALLLIAVRVATYLRAQPLREATAVAS